MLPLVPYEYQKGRHQLLPIATAEQVELSYTDQQVNLFALKAFLQLRNTSVWSERSSMSMLYRTDEPSELTISVLSLVAAR